MTVANNLAYLELRHSGGGSNSDGNASLGGVKSSHRIKSKTITGISNITGVTIDDAPGTPAGAGTLSYVAATHSLVWTCNGGYPGATTPLAEDGRYVIPGSTGNLHITVAYGSLPGINKSDTLTVTQIANALFDDIAKEESYAGAVDYRCFYVHNAHVTDSFFGCRVYIGSNTTGADDIAIALDLAGTGDGSSTGVADTIADELTAPSPSLTFTAPSSIGSSLLIGDLAAGESAAVWMKRNVPAATTSGTAADLSSLTINVGY